MRYAKLVGATCSLFLTNHMCGQPSNEYTFRHITQRDGLVSNTVYGMVQDKRGFVWIGTDEGLQRYDGYRFVTYQDELNSADKSNISVGSLDLVGNNTLICGNKKLDLPTNFISPYTKEDFLKNGTDTRIFRGNRDTTWLIGNQSVYACIGANTSAYIAARDFANDQYWVVINRGLVLLDGKTKRAYTAADNPLHHSLLTQAGGISAKAIMVDSRHNIWFSTWTHQFFCFDAQTKRLRSYSLLSIKPEHNEDVQLLVNYILEDDHHSIWLATANAGLLKYDPQKDNFTVINANPDNSRGIQYNFEIFWIMQDREGNLWLGTDKGINIFNPYNQNFQVVRNTPGTNNTLPHREITSLIQTKRGNILVGTWGGGVVVYDSQWRFKRKINFPGRLEENLVWSFVESNDGKIWIGCQHGYINI
ncbi:MAG TPA: two-component regulator propeller domain-containing protein, partial [Chitinophagaceae bacterium]|nr:two-component regulator propeller domain-containing protein [Chitinophagaceae bacterium]